MTSEELEDRDWLNPISMQVLKEAVEKGEMTVTLNGNRFDIEYRPGTIGLSRSDGGFVPRGTIQRKRLERFQFDAAE